jgi:ABC-2 type transport system permease protein
MNHAFTGTFPLLRHAIRLDHWKLLPWFLVFGFLPVFVYSLYGSLFPSPVDALALQSSLSTNPAFSLLLGPATDLSTAIGFTTWRLSMFGMFFAALMAVLTVTRHTRAAEDSGQAELLDSGVVGRHARLASAVLLAWLACAAVGLLVGATLILAGAPPTSAYALGGLMGGTGVAFAGVAAVTAQLGSVARTANTLAGTVLGISYLVRGLGDTLEDANWLLWVSPMGWAEHIRPASENNAAPLLLLVGVGGLLVFLGGWLSSRRDFGLGLIPTRPGPARGRAGIWGLTSRLNRLPFWTWGVNLLGLGSVFGLVTGTLTSAFADNPFVRQLIAFRVTTEEQLVYGFVEVLLLILGIIGAVLGIQLALRFYVEEEERRSEWILSAPLSRLRHVIPTAAVSILAPALGMVIASLALAIASNASGSPLDTGKVVLQGAAELPAIWLAAGVALALIGLAPGLRSLAWLLLVYWLLLTFFGPILKAPEWLLDTSPFHVVPHVFSAGTDWLSTWWTLAIAAILVVAGLAGYRRRDLVCT